MDVFGLGIEPEAQDTNDDSPKTQEPTETLVEYLTRMISPPNGNVLVIEDLDGYDFGPHSDLSVHGVVLIGEIKPHHSKELDRVLVPGAHIMAISPEDNPVSYKGTCVVEDAGFEIRDTIYYADEGKGFHYCAKASRSEREAGCEHLASMSGAEAVDREEGTAGLDNPRAGAGRTASSVRNFHPTVKPIEIMEWCLRDIPTSELVVEPFAGSGTTLLACCKTGHSVIGIEKDPEYAPIADARVRYWSNGDFKRPEGTEFQSEAEPEVEEVEEQSLNFLDMFSREFGAPEAPALVIRNRSGDHKVKLWIGDCAERMRDIETGSVGAIVTDPPYGLKFMNKEFDDLGEGAQQREWHVVWLQEAFRILKPGGIIKAFCGTRTMHHLLAAMQEVGFVGRDSENLEVEAWVYGSGFPKSLNIYKALQKMQENGDLPLDTDIEQWKGWGTALKPAWEPICIGIKPGQG